MTRGRSWLCRRHRAGSVTWRLVVAGTMAVIARTSWAAEPVSTARPARLLILREEGPALVAVELTVEGRSPHEARARAVFNGLPREAEGSLRLISWADFWTQDRDRWLLAAEEPADSDPETLERLTLIYDRDRDGLVDPDERHAWLASDAFLGPAVALAEPPLPTRVVSGCLAWLDQDRDGRLSPAEQTEAGERLRTCDLNGDEWLDPDEVGSRLAGDAGGPWSEIRTGERPLALFWLDEVPRSLASAAIDEAYGLDRANHARLDPPGRELLARLDADQNGRLSTAELTGLNAIEPDWLLVVRWDMRHFLFDPRPESVVVGWIGPRGLASAVPREADARGVDAAAGPAWLRLDVTAPPSPSAALAAARQAFDQADRDQNAYLADGEVSEFAMRWRLVGSRLAAEGEVRWDARLISLLERRWALERATVRLEISRAADPGWTCLDTSGDGRLSLREQSAAASRLAAGDANGDGVLTADELPRPIQLRVVAGQPLAGAERASAGSSAGGPDAPRWFQASDLNRDGDLSPGEFLGTPAQFAALDRDDDGLIDPAEAQPDHD